MADFDFQGMIDTKKLEIMSEDEILIGFPSGLSHAGTGESIAEIAIKLSKGAGPQTWETNRRRNLGFTKSGKIKWSKTATQATHHVDGIPARPFLEEGIGDGAANIQKRIEKYYDKKLNGQSADTELRSIGAVAVGSVQDFVKGDYYKSTCPNSETTIFAKGSDTPLIDTGQLINSLTYVVKNVAAKSKQDKIDEKKAAKAVS
jgi:hypothetical protein